ncbi:MAG: HAD-IIIA family hydrolase [Deltaproteobacteria bacterium]|nr:HAD-IIIA family hydrolase [Deltaproteobacteria bacterium]
MQENDTCSPHHRDGDYPGDCEFTRSLLEKAAARTENQERGYAWRMCLPKAREVKLLLLDVDGVLTDGSIAYTDEGSEIKTFHVRDGFGMNLLRQAGVEIGLITARSSKALERRVRDLNLTHVYQGKRQKVEVFAQLIKELQLAPAQVAYMGDDWLDLPLLARVGFSATVADSAPEVREIVDYVARRPGGRGAVREICDLIIDAKGLYQDLLGRYLS